VTFLSYQLPRPRRLNSLSGSDRVAFDDGDGTSHVVEHIQHVLVANRAVTMGSRISFARGFEMRKCFWKHHDVIRYSLLGLTLRKLFRSQAFKSCGLSSIATAEVGLAGE
jgi:hypothetical protein